MAFIRVLGTAFSVVFLSVLSLAETSKKELREEVKTIEALCDFSKARVYCKKSPEALKAYSWGATRVNDHKQFEVFSEIAFELAQLWADTILEGPYQAEGDTELLRIVEIQKEGKTVIYRITYTESAYNAESCADSQAPSKMSCVSGKIIETSYLDKTLRVHTRGKEKA
ncbi:MAG: hypothetical protein AB7H97_16165, partial [Pseudobdellovibrionaceae bacterium]